MTFVIVTEKLTFNFFVPVSEAALRLSAEIANPNKQMPILMDCIKFWTGILRGIKKI